MGPHQLLYGSAGGGGTEGQGALFALIPSGKSYEERVVYSFMKSGDALGPNDSLVVRHGEIFGTTVFGGDNPNGAVFEVTPFPKP